MLVSLDVRKNFRILQEVLEQTLHECDAVGTLQCTAEYLII